MNNSSNINIDDYIRQFKNAETTFSPRQVELKKNAFASFQKLGFPTTRNEEWKYTNVASFVKNSFHIAGNEQPLKLNDIKHFLPEEGDVILLVFHNGKFNSTFSHLSSLPKGIIAGNLSDFSDHAEVQKHIGKIALHNNESFVALNTALFQHGAFVFADKNVSSEKPIYLLFVNDARHAATVTYPRNLVVTSEGS